MDILLSHLSPLTVRLKATVYAATTQGLSSKRAMGSDRLKRVGRHSDQITGDSSIATRGGGSARRLTTRYIQVPQSKFISTSIVVSRRVAVVGRVGLRCHHFTHLWQRRPTDSSLRCHSSRLRTQMEEKTRQCETQSSAGLLDVTRTDGSVECALAQPPSPSSPLTARHTTTRFLTAVP